MKWFIWWMPKTQLQENSGLENGAKPTQFPTEFYNRIFQMQWGNLAFRSFAQIQFYILTHKTFLSLRLFLFANDGKLYSQIFGRCQHQDNHLDRAHHRLHPSVQPIHCSPHSIAKTMECHRTVSISIHLSVWITWKASLIQWMAIWMALVRFYAVQRMWRAVHSSASAWFAVTKMWALP